MRPPKSKKKLGGYCIREERNYVPGVGKRKKDMQITEGVKALEKSRMWPEVTTGRRTLMSL